MCGSCSNGRKVIKILINGKILFGMIINKLSLQKLVPINLKNRVEKIMRYFLLFLFLGYYGNITLFTHTHILNGVTIVHSHPYSTGANGKPVNHQHSEKGFIIIHLLSNFIATALFLALGIAIVHKFITSYLIKICIDFIQRFSGFCTFSLRAPPRI